MVDLEKSLNKVHNTYCLFSSVTFTFCMFFVPWMYIGFKNYYHFKFVLLKFELWARARGEILYSRASPQPLDAGFLSINNNLEYL